MFAPWEKGERRGESAALDVRLGIDVASVSYGEDEDHDFVILKLGDDAIVSDAVTPLSFVVCG